MINLIGQVAFITGGSRGIGAATTIMFAKAGADVAITYVKDSQAANSLVKEVKQLGRKAIAIKGNVANVNNAGVWTYGPVTDMSEKTWNETINVNLKGTFNMCKAVVPLMKKNKYGRIINIASTAGQRGEAFHSHYAASKGGVITDMTLPVFEDKEYMKLIEKTIPRGKIATADEIAGPILFLASKLSNNLVGEIINVNGGSVLCG